MPIRLTVVSAAIALSPLLSELTAQRPAYSDSGRTGTGTRSIPALTRMAAFRAVGVPAIRGVAPSPAPSAATWIAGPPPSSSGAGRGHAVSGLVHADSATVDSARRGVPASTDAARAGVGRRSVARGKSDRRQRMPIIFYGALATAAAASVVLHVDPDSGGYHDGWTTATDFPDKAIHALAAWAITSVGVDLGARPRYAALAVCAAGTAFEFAQGYVSPYDVVADCVGAAGAGLWQTWRARHRARAPAAR